MFVNIRRNSSKPTSDVSILELSVIENKTEHVGLVTRSGLLKPSDLHYFSSLMLADRPKYHVMSGSEHSLIKSRWKLTFPHLRTYRWKTVWSPHPWQNTLTPLLKESPDFYRSLLELERVGKRCFIIPVRFTLRFWNWIFQVLLRILFWILLNLFKRAINIVPNTECRQSLVDSLISWCDNASNFDIILIIWNTEFILVHAAKVLNYLIVWAECVFVICH